MRSSRKICSAVPIDSRSACRQGLPAARTCTWSVAGSIIASAYRPSVTRGSHSVRVALRIGAISRCTCSCARSRNGVVSRRVSASSCTRVDLRLRCRKSLLSLGDTQQAGCPFRPHRLGALGSAGGVLRFVSDHVQVRAGSLERAFCRDHVGAGPGVHTRCVGALAPERLGRGRGLLKRALPRRTGSRRPESP